MHCRIRVFGKVQGVAFRYYTKLKADELGLVGTTENLGDGSVVIMVQGSKEEMDLFMTWCHEGSPASEVKKVNMEDLSGSESQEYKEFSILR